MPEEPIIQQIKIESVKTNTIPYDLEKGLRLTVKSRAKAVQLNSK